MISEPTRSELRQHWAKGHDWTFVLEGEKLVMNANEKGNHFHNDIPLDQIDPYESEEKFFHLRWPMRVVRTTVIVGLFLAYAFAVAWWVLGHPQWFWLVLCVLALAGAGGAWAYHLKNHRMLMRFYHRMSGVELFAVFTELPDKDSADKFLTSLKREIPPWSYTLGAPTKTDSMARELKALHQLRKEAVLTNEEFQFKKRELLTDYFGHDRNK